MANKIELKNVKVSFSTMLNRPEKAKFGRCFRILVPFESKEYEQIKSAYEDLAVKAQKAYSEKLDKKLKKANTEVLDESVYNEGFIELPFNVKFNKNDEEVLNPIYKNSENFCYFVNNNGEKMYETESGKKIYPLSGNIVDATISLVAKYDSKNNRPSIMFKAEDIKILQSDFGKKSSGSSTGFITLDGETEVPERVEKAKPTKSDEVFEEDDLAGLDL